MTQGTPPPTPTGQDTRAQQRQLVQQWIARAGEGRDLFDYIHEHAHPHITVHTPDGRTGNRDTLDAYTRQLRDTYPNLTAELDAISFATDRLIVQARLTPDPDAPTATPFALIARIDETARILEVWGYLGMVVGE